MRKKMDLRVWLHTVSMTHIALNINVSSKLKSAKNIIWDQNESGYRRTLTLDSHIIFPWDSILTDQRHFIHDLYFEYPFSALQIFSPFYAHVISEDYIFIFFIPEFQN